MTITYTVPHKAAPTLEDIIDSKRPGLPTGVEGKPAGVMITFNMNRLAGQSRGAVQSMLALAISAVLDDTADPLME